MAAHAAFYLKANCSSYCISFLVFLFECQQSSVAMDFASCAAAVVIAAVPVISNSTRSFDLLTFWPKVDCVAFLGLCLREKYCFSKSYIIEWL